MTQRLFCKLRENNSTPKEFNQIYINIMFKQLYKWVFYLRFCHNVRNVSVNSTKKRYFFRDYVFGCKPFSHQTPELLCSHPLRCLHLFTCSENTVLLHTSGTQLTTSQIQLPHYSIRQNDLNSASVPSSVIFLHLFVFSYPPLSF